MFFVVFISLFRPISTQWFHLATEVLALDKWLQIFSPLMGYGSPFGGFVSPFVGFVGFAFGFAFFFFFFVQESRWPMVIGAFGYEFTIERKER